MRLRELLNLTGLPIFIASLCCITPIVLVLFGLSTVAFAASLTNLLEGKYQWAFILVGLIALTISLIFYFRKTGICTIDQVQKHRNEIINKTILSLLAAGVGYYIFFYILLDFIGRKLGIWS